MKNHHIPPTDTQATSGLFILFHSTTARFLVRFWHRINDLARPFLPLFHIFMIATTLTVLGAVVFANQHIPCWYDEICMIDPAYHRTTTGLWHSIAQWDSFDVVPFAPNYPLLINILRCLIFCFGVNSWILRGIMLVFGLLPIAMLLWIFRRIGILRSWQEILASVYFVACFTFFHWATRIRPEAVLLTVVVLLAFAWAYDHPILLFLAALLIPLCGLQWNVLLLPVAFHWLVFGGRFRNPIIVSVAMIVSTVATIVTYHLLGMWPSYLQEAARVGGIDIVHNVCTKMRGAIAFWDWSWFVGAVQTPFYVIVGPMLAWGISALSLLHASQEDKRTSRLLAFVVATSLASVFFLGLVGHLLREYVYILALPTCLLFPNLTRRWLFRRHVLLFMLIVLAAPWVANVHWNQISNGSGPWGGYAGDKFWADEATLETTFEQVLRPDDIICCDNAAYFALRRQNRPFYLLRYAFSIDPVRARTISALLMIDPPWIDASVPLAIPDPESIPECAELDSPGTILARLSKHWNCTFTEVFLPPPTFPNAIRYRLFRPVFHSEQAQS